MGVGYFRGWAIIRNPYFSSESDEDSSSADEASWSRQRQLLLPHPTCCSSAVFSVPSLEEEASLGLFSRASRCSSVFSSPSIATISPRLGSRKAACISSKPCLIEEKNNSIPWARARARALAASELGELDFAANTASARGGLHDAHGGKPIFLLDGRKAFLEAPPDNVFSRRSPDKASYCYPFPQPSAPATKTATPSKKCGTGIIFYHRIRCETEHNI